MCVLKATSCHLEVLLTYKLLLVHSLTWSKSINASCKMTQSSWGAQETTIYNHHLLFFFFFTRMRPADAEFLPWRWPWRLRQWFNRTHEMSLVDTSVKAFPRWSTPSMFHCHWEFRGKKCRNKDTSLQLMCFERSGEVHAGETFSFSPSHAQIFVLRCLHTEAFFVCLFGFSKIQEWRLKYDILARLSRQLVEHKDAPSWILKLSENHYRLK